MFHAVKMANYGGKINPSGRSGGLLPPVTVYVMNSLR